MKKMIVLAFVLLLTACGSKLDGTYSAPGGLNLVFNDGKVTMPNAAGGQMEAAFSVEGNKIKFRFGGAGNAIVLIQNPDGTLNGNGVGFGTFTKQ